MPPVIPSDREIARLRAIYARRKSSLSGGRYSYFNRGNLFLIQERERKVLHLLERYRLMPLKEKSILEVGCGDGLWLREFVKWGACPENLAGIDLLPERIATARRLSPSGVTFSCGNAQRLEFEDSSFDIVMQSTLFTLIRDRQARRQVASEMMRVTKKNGVIFWYDYFLNPRNRDAKAVGKKEIHEHFSGCRVDLYRTTLAPPLARFVAPYSWLICSLLSQIPWLCGHYFGVIQRNGAACELEEGDKDFTS